MSAPFISVCVPTNRVGGLDILVAGLLAQSFTDFELVISDAVQRRQRAFIPAGTLPFMVRHVSPRFSRFPESQFSHVANEAVAAARGEIILFIVDYTWLPPTLLETHANFHARHDRRQALMMPHQYYEMPALHQIGRAHV